MNRGVAAALGALVVAGHAEAQDLTLRSGAQVTGLLTTASPMPTNRWLTEARLVQPVGIVDASWRSFTFSGMADLEAATIAGGQLTPGAWGEGFIDRRHPHTVFHEMIVSWSDSVGGGLRASISAGKGFAPFGSDDPMNRPVLLYPVNHHWSQILERAVAIAGVKSRRVALELGVFNGDEPTGPWSWPRLGRFGDSWSARLLVWPHADWELQLSRASVESPENRDAPLGPRDEKWSASARWTRTDGATRRYAMVELARTTDSATYDSFLAEMETAGQWSRGYVRLEISERPEPVRLGDPFRYTVPATDSGLGSSRWFVLTAGSGISRQWRELVIEPVAEVSIGYVTGAGGSFTPAAFYGSGELWSLTIGVRVGACMPLHRMGRYGVLHEPMPMPMSTPMSM